MTKYFKNEFAINGDKADIPNEIQASGEVSYQMGFGIDYQRKLGTDILAKPFPRQGFNGLISDITGAIQQYQQNGFFDFITPEMNSGSAFNYLMGATVRYDMSSAKDGSDIRIFTSLINNNKGNPEDNPSDWQQQGAATSTGNGFVFTNISSSTVLTEEQTGVVLIDASASDIVVTLPSTTLSIDFILRRIDNSDNRVKISISATDKIRYNLSSNANGYSFFNLFGAGDYWRVISDGTGNWYDIERKDNTPIGATSFFITSAIPVGGYIAANGSLLSRADYPYLWDFAQKSGVLVEETAKAGYDGCFTTGDGVATFRVPDLRGEFLRGLDSDRGLDVNRAAGSSQDDTMQKMVGEVSLSQSGGLSRVNPNGVLTNGSQSTIFIASNSAMYTANASIVFNNALSARTSNENRPKNIAYPVFMKII